MPTSRKRKNRKVKVKVNPHEKTLNVTRTNQHGFSLGVTYGKGYKGFNLGIPLTQRNRQKK